MAEVKACLEERGLEVLGSELPRRADDRDAPDVGELVVGGGTFVAFYSSEARADRLARALRAAAARLGGVTTRHGKITVLYTKQPGLTGSTGKPDDRVEGCV